VGLQRLEASDETIKGFIFPLGSYAGAAFVMALSVVLFVLRSFLSQYGRIARRSPKLILTQVLSYEARL